MNVPKVLFSPSIIAGANEQRFVCQIRHFPFGLSLITFNGVVQCLGIEHVFMVTPFVGVSPIADTVDPIAVVPEMIALAHYKQLIVIQRAFVDDQRNAIIHSS